jgi:hypothetical protein
MQTLLCVPIYSAQWTRTGVQALYLEDGLSSALVMRDSLYRTYRATTKRRTTPRVAWMSTHQGRTSDFCLGVGVLEGGRLKRYKDTKIRVKLTRFPAFFADGGSDARDTC